MESVLTLVYRRAKALALILVAHLASSQQHELLSSRKSDFLGLRLESRLLFERFSWTI